ncbi:YraN family protein [Edaphobacter flagellatus]|uniref:YraN family protein n=1 Tax=Edaphobacter flagellatus TaxID=1933044 RepID=UPI0021B1C59C|nr:YraN family protein [Edaphobacter flagellatus]
MDSSPHTARPGSSLPISSSRPGLVRRAWIGLQARALRRLATLARRRRHAPAHLVTGIDGEREAIFFLRLHGYTIVARRWRNPKLRGDLDLIAWEGPTLCFIEIKTRSRHDAIPAEAAIDADKQQTLRKLARSYIRRLPPAARGVPARFDVLSIYLDGAPKQPETRISESVQERHPQPSPHSDPSIILNKGAFGWA